MKMFLVWNEDDTFIKIEKAYFDGYALNERLFEDVFFEITIQDDKFVVAIPGKYTEYFKGLNREHWLQKATDMCLTHDNFVSAADWCGDDVVVYDDALPFDQQLLFLNEPPVIVPAPVKPEQQTE